MAAIWLRPSPLSRPCGQASATGRAMSTTIDKGEPAAELAPHAPTHGEHVPDRSDTDSKADKKSSDEAAPSDTNEPDKDAKAPDKPKSRWPLILIGIAVLLAIIGGGIYWYMNRNLEDTDDAYTEGNAIAIAANISGYVTELAINDNSDVKAGQLLFKIDPRTYIAARDQARANLALTQAKLASAKIDLQIALVRAPANLLQAQAQLAQARANADQARQNYDRQHGVDPRATTQTNIDQANAQLKSQGAMVTQAQASEKIADLVAQNVALAESQTKQSEAEVAQAEANLAIAEVNLSYTVVRAPQDGFVTQRNVDLGTYVQAGQQSLYLVAPQIWVVANFKEDQLDRMRPGQKVTMTVDAYPELTLQGHLDSIQAGSGARFSAFPAENATGNYVKIVRRVPVKIDIDSGLPQGQSLPLGLSVETTVSFP